MPILAVASALALVACSGPAPGALTQKQTDFIASTGSIDSRLSSDQQVPLKLGQTICAEIAAGRPIDQIVADAQRFAQGESTISKDQAVKLVAAARDKLCS